MIINKHHGGTNLSRRNGSIQYICIHYTAGTGSALNNCKYFAGGNRNASADYFVDDSGIWEYNDPSSGYFSWAVGDGGGKYGITNANSISIEVVSPGTPFTDAEIGHLRELVPYLMAKFGVPAERVVRHYDASRKRCPAPYIDAAAWNTLHAQITGAVAPSVQPATSDDLNALADAVIRGEYGTGEARKRALGDKYDAVQALVNQKLGVNGAAPSTNSVNLEDLATRVINGEFGNGEQRKRALGANYDAVQAIVNQRLTGAAPTSSVDLESLATRAINGEFGNGDARKKALGSNYDAVQAIVNRRLGQ